MNNQSALNVMPNQPVTAVVPGSWALGIMRRGHLGATPEVHHRRSGGYWYTIGEAEVTGAACK